MHWRCVFVRWIFFYSFVDAHNKRRVVLFNFLLNLAFVCLISPFAETKLLGSLSNINGQKTERRWKGGERGGGGGGSDKEEREKKKLIGQAKLGKRKSEARITKKWMNINGIVAVLFIDLFIGGVLCRFSTLCLSSSLSDVVVLFLFLFPPYIRSHSCCVLCCAPYCNIVHNVVKTLIHSLIWHWFFSIELFSNGVVCVCTRMCAHAHITSQAP